MTEKNYFEELNAIDVSKYIEKKNGLSYVSWANAWAEVKKRYPSSTYTIYENKDGLNYHTDGRTGWVKTGVTVNDIEHIEYLPIMDYRNQSIPLAKITSFDVNKAIQRSLTKACARHGLGLYVYAGEDLPEQKQEQKSNDDIYNGALNWVKQQQKITPKTVGYSKLMDLVNSLYGKDDAKYNELNALINERFSEE